jgi:hypothetical protein
MRRLFKKIKSKSKLKNKIYKSFNYFRILKTRRQNFFALKRRINLKALKKTQIKIKYKNTRFRYNKLRRFNRAKARFKKKNTQLRVKILRFKISKFKKPRKSNPKKKNSKKKPTIIKFF